MVLFGLKIFRRRGRRGENHDVMANGHANGRSNKDLTNDKERRQSFKGDSETTEGRKDSMSSTNGGSLKHRHNFPANGGSEGGAHNGVRGGSMSGASDKKETYQSISFSERLLSSSNAAPRFSSTDRNNENGAVRLQKVGSRQFYEYLYQIRTLSLSYNTAFKVLLLPRAISAVLNIVHDCDETFNYWEPLHYLLHGDGLQTWEYSARFGLRTWLYIALHALPAALFRPIKYLFPDLMPAVVSFYVVRMALAILSASCDAMLVAAISKVTERRVALFFLIFVMSASAVFMQSTAFLPSSFSMMMITISVASVLNKNPMGIVTTSGISCLVGWPFTALACAPFGIAAILDSSLTHIILLVLVCFIGIMAPMIVVDRIMYGQWILTQFNLLHYNVFGGGDSTLYGVEPWTFYFRNLLNGFNAVFPLALLSFPCVWLVARDTGDRIRLLVILAPLYTWLAFMSIATAHKEERFMAPIYSIICVGGAIAAAGLCRIGELMMEANRMGKRGLKLFNAACWTGVMLTALLSTSRTAALLTNYGAPMYIYNSLPSTDTPRLVCLGSEWHRFPSSFHLPKNYKVGFFKTDSNLSMLPVYFDHSIGGSAGSPAALNDRNLPHKDTYVDEETCDFVIELVRHDSTMLEINDYKGLTVSSLFSSNSNMMIPNEKGLNVIMTLPFLDAERSPSLTRAFFIPHLSRRWNSMASYTLYQNAKS